MSGLSKLSIIDMLEHPDLLGRVFQGPSWDAWKSLLRVEYGLPLSQPDRERLARFAGRQQEPADWVRRSYRRLGRRAGKDTMAGAEGAYRATCVEYPLRPGEIAVILILAANKQQARYLHRTVRAYFRQSRLLEPLVIRENAHEIELRNNVVIETVAANQVAPRNRTIVMAIANEAAFWPSDENSSNLDAETLIACEAGMATIPNAKTIIMSSPHARKGELFRAEERFFGKDELDDTVYWVAGTRDLNPTVPAEVVDRALREDPERAAAEFLAQWRSDCEDFMSLDAIRAAMVAGRHELPRVPGSAYVAFVDPSGGSSDSMTLGIAHRERRAGNDVCVLDCLREVRPPFNPDEVAGEFASVVRGYGLSTVHGDRYGGEWPRERFRVHGVDYLPASQTRSELYTALLPILNAGRAELLDDARLLAQLNGLERRATRTGRDSIDHRPGAHDDLANAAAGALVLADETRQKDGMKILAWSPHGGPGSELTSAAYWI